MEKTVCIITNGRYYIRVLYEEIVAGRKYTSLSLCLYARPLDMCRDICSCVFNSRMNGRSSLSRDSVGHNSRHYVFTRGHVVSVQSVLAGDTLRGKGDIIKLEKMVFYSTQKQDIYPTRQECSGTSEQWTALVYSAILTIVDKFLYL